MQRAPRAMHFSAIFNIMDSATAFTETSSKMSVLESFIATP
jgi:hypothetical protein